MKLPALALVMGLAACGGDDPAPEPLIAASLTASYAGTAFTPTNGFVALYMDRYLVVLGDGSIRCGSEHGNSPPPGHTAVFAIPSIEVGVHSSFTQMFTNVDELEGVGSSDGTVTITASTDASIAGSVAYDYTDDESRIFTISGTFEAIRCP